MKLIEGMKKLKILEKHIGRNTERITQYASLVSTEKPFFGSEDDQRKEVNSLIQSNNDLFEEYIHLKKRVDTTNLSTEVTIGNRNYILADLLIIRRGLGKTMEKTYQALNDTYGHGRLMLIQRNVQLQSGEKPPHVIRLYDESDRIEGLQHWQELLDTIEQRLEVINATTDLVVI
jgi:hypothetical protein